MLYPRVTRVTKQMLLRNPELAAEVLSRPTYYAQEILSVLAARGDEGQLLYGRMRLLPRGRGRGPIEFLVPMESAAAAEASHILSIRNAVEDGLLDGGDLPLGILGERFGPDGWLALLQDSLTRGA